MALDNGAACNWLVNGLGGNLNLLTRFVEQGGELSSDGREKLKAYRETIDKLLGGDKPAPEEPAEAEPVDEPADVSDEELNQRLLSATPEERRRVLDALRGSDG